MNPPSDPMSSQGMTIPGSRDSNSCRQGQMAAKMVTASRIAVLSTVPWIVIARASVRDALGELGSTATKPPNDFDERAGLEVRKAVFRAMRGSLALPFTGQPRGKYSLPGGQNLRRKLGVGYQIVDQDRDGRVGQRRVGGLPAE